MIKLEVNSSLEMKLYIPILYSDSGILARVWRRAQGRLYQRRDEIALKPFFM